jgi:hypothetical protein
MAEEYQDSQQNLDPQPNGQQFTEQQQSNGEQSGGQAPEETDQVKESIQKAVAKNMGGKRERGTSRLGDFQKAQQVNSRFYNPLRQKRQN